MRFKWWVLGSLLVGLIHALNANTSAAADDPTDKPATSVNSTTSVNVSSTVHSGSTLGTLMPTSMSSTFMSSTTVQETTSPTELTITPTSTSVPPDMSSTSETIVSTSMSLSASTSSVTLSLTPTSSSTVVASTLTISLTPTLTVSSSSSLSMTAVSTQESSSSVTSSMVATSSVVPTSTVPVASSMSPTSSITVTSSAMVTSPAPPTVFLINEFTFTGIYGSKQEFFVEIKRVGGTENPGLTVVVMNADDNSPGCQTVLTFEPAIGWKNNLKHDTTNLPESQRLGVIVALYTGVTWQSCDDINLTSTGPAADVVIVAKDADVPANDTLMHFLSDNPSHVFIAKSKDNDKGSYSVSRCKDTPRDPWAFILSSPTPKKPNQCLLQKYSNIVKMTFNDSKCEMFNTSNKKQTIVKLVDFMVMKIGRDCTCGSSPLLFSLQGFECKSMTVTWSISAVSQQQLDLLKSQYDALLELAYCIPTTDKGDKLCVGKTCVTCSHLPDSSKKDGNIKVTISVVAACIFIFLVLVIIIIVYIRKKRRGILQFRMTRLDEDDDDLMIAPDMDDFVGGGGQDASFNNPMYSRFK